MSATRHSQAGITALGFLILALLVGVVGYAVIKLTPIYIANMRMNTILDDVQKELSGEGPTPQTIRYELSRRFSIENVRLSIDTLAITQSKTGYTLRVQYEDRTPYIANVYLLVTYDKQVEITR